MSEHTQTPWRVEQGTDLIWGACNPDDISSDGMGYSIVQGRSSSWGERKPDMAEREANAAFIVKACNHHEALVEALADLVDAVRRDADEGGRGISGYTAARLTDARAALASIKESA